MEILDQLCVALGFATLAGINLYLVVLVTGLAIRFQWVILDAPYEQLAVLGEPTVIAAAGLFFALEFFSDKVPWVDSLWDTIHTLVRPVGGGLLAIQTLGQAEPALIVVTAMLAAGTTTITHGFKAGSRLAVNTSPEPFSNIGVSLAEDVAVMGGLGLMAVDPKVAAVVFLIFIGFALFLTPKLFRYSKAFLWILGKRFGLIGNHDGLTAEDRIALGKGEVLWSQRLVTGRSVGFGLPSNMIGTLVATNGERARFSFVGRRLWRTGKWTLELGDGVEISRETKLFTENINLFEVETGRHLVLRLPRNHAELAGRIVAALKQAQAAALVLESVDQAI